MLWVYNFLIAIVAFITWSIGEGLINMYLGNSHKDDFRWGKDASLSAEKILCHPKRLKDLFISITVGIISFPSIMVVIVMIITVLTEIGGSKKKILNPDWLKLLVIILKEYLFPALVCISLLAAVIFFINAVMFSLVKKKVGVKEFIISLKRFLETVILWLLDRSIYVPLEKIEKAHFISKKLLTSINHAYWSHGTLGTTGYSFLSALLLTVICVLMCLLYDNYYSPEIKSSSLRNVLKEKSSGLVSGLLFIMCFIAVLYLYATGKILPISF